MKLSARWLALLAAVLLPFSFGLKAEAAPKVTLLIHPTLFKAAGGPTGIVAELEREKGIKVEVVTGSGQKGLREKSMLSFSSGGGEFDVVTFIDPWINEETIGMFEPLDKYISSAPAAYEYEDLIGSLRQVGRFPKPGGATYGVPYRIGTGIFYYRKDLFKKAGLSPPKTWAEFLVAAEKLTQPGVYGVVQRGKSGTSVEQDFLRYLHSTGHGVLSDGKYKCLLTRPESVKMLEIFAAPFQNGWAPPDMLAYGRDEYRTAIMQGRAAMGLYFSPYWGLLTNPKKSNVADKLGWFLVPTLDGKNVGATYNGGWWLIMDKKSKNKKAAWELIMALTNKKNQLRAALNWANGPTRSSVYKSSEYLKKFPVAKDWLTALSRGTAAAQHPRAAEIRDITSKEVINFLQKKKTAKQAMADACSQLAAKLR